MGHFWHVRPIGLTLKIASIFANTDDLYRPAGIGTADQGGGGGDGGGGGGGECIMVGMVNDGSAGGEDDVDK